MALREDVCPTFRSNANGLSCRVDVDAEDLEAREVGESLFDRQVEAKGSGGQG